MTKKLRTKYHSRWRVDADFLDTLSPADREYYEKFIGEYYRAEFKNNNKDIHKTVARRRECYRRIKEADMDIVTASNSAVSAHQAEPLKTRVGPGGYKGPTPYTMADYPTICAPMEVDDEDSQD